MGMKAHPAQRCRKLFALYEATIQVVFQSVFLKPFWPLASVFIARRATFFIAYSALLLTGCSSLRIVDSQVSSFSKLSAAPAANVAWTLERLPSQQNLPNALAARQAALEAALAQELSSVGFASKPQSGISSAPYSVQIGVRLQKLDHGPFDDPHGFGGLGSFGLIGRDYVVTRMVRWCMRPCGRVTPCLGMCAK